MIKSLERVDDKRYIKTQATPYDVACLMNMNNDWTVTAYFTTKSRALRSLSSDDVP